MFLDCPNRTKEKLKVAVEAYRKVVHFGKKWINERCANVAFSDDSKMTFNLSHTRLGVNRGALFEDSPISYTHT